MYKLRHHVITLVVALLCIVHSSSQRSTPDSTDYVAAVVEYHPEQSVDATTTFFKNVHNYITLIEEAANSTNDVDIIVFPEAGLSSLDHKVFTIVPLPSANIVPCTDTSGLYENLRLLSCAARDNQIYVVVNLSERFYCPKGTQSEYDEPCPESEVLNYNSNVAFDRDGSVIAKYRKYNLFGEDGMVSPPVADLVTFDTDFGVRFGMFICFDLMFEKPAIQLVKEMSITDIIFPTAWFSELPFLTAVQAQAAWAYGMDVNFLASGYNTPAGGSAGSGIYEGRKGPLVNVMPLENKTQLLIHSVQKKNKIDINNRPRSNANSEETVMLPISQTNKAADGIFMKEDDMSAYTTQLLDSVTTGEIHLCNNELCCTFEVTGSMSSDHVVGEGYFNRVVVFNGVRSFDGFATGGVQICAVVSCANAQQSSCGAELNVVPTTFTGIRIRGDFNSGTATQFPNTLLDKYDVIPMNDFSFQQDVVDDKVACEAVLLKEASLLTFGIYGREFTRDGEAATSSGMGLSSTVSLSMIFLCVLSYLN